MSLNQKDIRIKKLYEKGVKQKADIARKLGYAGKELDNGVRRVEEAFARLGIDKE